MRKNEKIKRIGIEATLFLILLFIIKVGYPIEYTSRQYFQEVLNQRDQDSTISCSERVLGLSSLYRIFCGIDELAVYNYFPDPSINNDQYITSTITNNHWIQLVMQEGEITTLKIEVKEAKLQAQQVQLINMVADCNYRDGHLFLTIRKTNQKGMIVFNGIEKEPLFIFVDTPITRYDEKNSKRFEGYHRGNYILPEAVQKVYIPLGSYFVGTIYSNHDFEVIGHGIISQEGTKHSQYITGENNPIKCNIIAAGNAKMKIIHLTSIEPAMYHFWAWPGENCEYESVKAFSFHYETDAFIGTRITNCFTKVNDDNVKLYLSNITVNNLTVYLQGNGNVFQFGWGDYGSRSHILVENITLLRDLNLNDARYVRSFIDWREPIDKNIINDVVFRNIISFDEIKSFFSIGNEKTSNLTNQLHLNNFKMENINLTEGVHFKIKCSYVLENPIKLKDVTIKENLLSETNKSLFIDSLTMKNIFIINN